MSESNTPQTDANVEATDVEATDVEAKEPRPNVPMDTFIEQYRMFDTYREVAEAVDLEKASVIQRVKNYRERMIAPKNEGGLGYTQEQCDKALPLKDKESRRFDIDGLAGLVGLDSSEKDSQSC